MPETNHNLSHKDRNNFLLSWEFPEFVKHERSIWWYITTFTISGLFLIFAILTTNWLFALIIIMIDAILMMMQNKETIEIDFQIVENGIQLEKKFINYKEIASFWIIYEPPEIKTLYFDFKSKIRPGLSIPLGDVNPLKVRQILLEYLEENIDRESEPTSETLARMLKI